MTSNVDCCRAWAAHKGLKHLLKEAYCQLQVSRAASYFHHVRVSSPGSGFRVQVSRFRVQGLGLGFKVLRLNSSKSQSQPKPLPSHFLQSVHPNIINIETPPITQKLRGLRTLEEHLLRGITTLKGAAWK